MKFSLSLAALTALSGANAFCMIGICTKNGGCTTLSVNDNVWRNLPGGTLLSTRTFDI
ncbi:hypothetical protein B0H63DRAFT_530001 [Podospora didyma]|uniref:Uncharacterized protein n=1 Tax=Podospora didyma TaxID=330526 RepID=A0AAE0JYG2_9PEZI|nr:hypothetical protein B0H63DRAFT_530001 [Podospora didyma]